MTPAMLPSLSLRDMQKQITTLQVAERFFDSVVLFALFETGVFNALARGPMQLEDLHAATEVRALRWSRRGQGRRCHPPEPDDPANQSERIHRSALSPASSALIRSRVSPMSSRSSRRAVTSRSAAAGVTRE